MINKNFLIKNLNDNDNSRIFEEKASYYNRKNKNIYASRHEVFPYEEIVIGGKLVRSSIKNFKKLNLILPKKINKMPILTHLNYIFIKKFKFWLLYKLPVNVIKFLITNEFVDYKKKYQINKEFLTKNKHDITTILGKNVHEIVRKYSDQKKYDEYRINFEKAKKNLKFIPEYPIQIDFELNYSCNFSCSMCTWSVENAKGRGKSTWFNFKAFKEIIDEGVDKGLKAIRLNYINEPLIRKDIIDFIDYAKKKGCTRHIFKYQRFFANN